MPIKFDLCPENVLRLTKSHTDVIHEPKLSMPAEMIPKPRGMSFEDYKRTDRAITKPYRNFESSFDKLISKHRDPIDPSVFERKV